ncbi:restriction endonuclease [Anaerotruncus sp. AF02-27]|uniref:amidohydrolase family protein n=1 Tax=Anaerotruncus sp. AF02-27 TaxID=2292191 RepID=UPI000E4F1B22|nr:amidohydrolase family protein [Anaerotruncus sp. AF02-27]RGX57024.1 restriction endonuclease [Anaerotruncus sp. AF02-27]
MALDYTKLILKNGRIFDPGEGTDRVGDLYIRDNRIVPEAFPPDDETRVIDVGGHLVLPGLIDFHTHLNFGGSDVGLLPDLMLLPNGVTTAVDAGSCGVSNYESFSKYTIASSLTTLKSLLYIANTGQTTEAFAENLDPVHFDEARICRMFERYRGELLGIKIRLGKKFAPDISALLRAVKIADKAGCFLSVHMIDLPCPYEEALLHLRAGDLLVHPYHFRGVTIFDEAGRVRPCLIEAKKRGVLIDLACARYNHGLENLCRAVGQGFWPDFVTTDLGRNSIYERPVFALPYVMSVLLAAGMPLDAVVRGCTSTPAQKIGLAGQRGTLKPGAYADVAVMKPLEGERVFIDKLGYECKGNLLFSPRMTVKDGRILYQSIEI